MARPATRRLTARARRSAFPWTRLARPLAPAQREAIRRLLGGLLEWQRALRKWPPLRGAPDATPFVSLYAGGRLCGCFGSDEGPPGDRLARAFLRALDDARHGGAMPGEREGLVAQVSYVRRFERAPSVDAALARLEPGTHGVVLVREGAPAAILIPQVARDGGLSARGLLETLAKKAGVPFDALSHEGTSIFLFDAEEVTVRSQGRGPSPRLSPFDAAAAWLARTVDEEGAVAWGADLRGRKVVRTGAMHHGRAAVVVRALAAHGGYARVAERGRDRLDSDVRAALRGGAGAVEAWPVDPAVIAGTVALACLAGLPLGGELEALVGDGSLLEASPWHAAQVVAALGASAPARVWSTCLRALDTQPWAPWTAIAAQARGDGATLRRTARVLDASVRHQAPHAGGALTDLPELALTALVVEALAPVPRARAAVARARRFLERWQYAPGRIPAPLDEDLAAGAFPLSPVAPFARSDVTAHALLALRRPR